jgi:flagellar basal body-associated protein FliL
MLDLLFVNKMGVWGIVMIVLILVFIGACVVVPIVIVKFVNKKKQTQRVAEEQDANPLQ